MNKLLLGILQKGFKGKTTIYQREFFANLSWFGHDNNKEAIKQLEKLGWIEWNRRFGRLYDIRNDMFKNKMNREKD